MSLSTEKKQKRPKRKKATTYNQKSRKKKNRVQVDKHGKINRTPLDSKNIHVEIPAVPFSMDQLQQNVFGDLNSHPNVLLERKRTELQRNADERYRDLSSDARLTRINQNDSPERKRRKQENREELKREKKKREKKRREKEAEEWNLEADVQEDRRLIPIGRRMSAATIRTTGPSFSERVHAELTGELPYGYRNITSPELNPFVMHHHRGPQTPKQYLAGIGSGRHHINIPRFRHNHNARRRKRRVNPPPTGSRRRAQEQKDEQRVSQHVWDQVLATDPFARQVVRNEAQRQSDNLINRIRLDSGLPLLDRS